MIDIHPNAVGVEQQQKFRREHRLDIALCTNRREQIRQTVFRDPESFGLTGERFSVTAIPATDR
jgi:hypothetical protein